MDERKFTVFYDAGCNLCNGAVDFIRTRDRSARFRFLPLASPEAEGLLENRDGGCDTLHLLDEQGHHDRSDAVLRIAAHLGSPWSSIRFLRFIPRGLRNGLYDFVARNRFSWFGRTRPNACRRD